METPVQCGAVQNVNTVRLKFQAFNIKINCFCNLHCALKVVSIVVIYSDMQCLVQPWLVWFGAYLLGVCSHQ